MTNQDDHWFTRIRANKAYRSVHGDEQPQRGSDDSGVRWKTLAGAAVIFIVVMAGVVVAVRSLDAATGWLDLVGMKVTSDEAHVYLLLQTSGTESPDWSRLHYRIAIDTYDRMRGAVRLPPPYEAKTASGVEFLIDLGGPGQSNLLVVEGYDPFDGENPIYSRSQMNGDFRTLEVRTNRDRFSRDGRYFPAVSVKRGELTYATPDLQQPGRDARADVATRDGAIEIRIPWALLNVSDPSSRTVIHSLERGRQTIGTVRTEGFRFYAYSFRVTEEESELEDRLPSSGVAPLFRWETWDSPRHRLRPKESFELVERALRSIPDKQQPDSDATVLD